MPAGRIAIAVAALALPLAAAEHDAGCVPTRADPATTTLVDLRGHGGALYYVEERGAPARPLTPLSGFLFGDGTWVIRESNGIDAPDGSLQRTFCGGGGGPADCVGGGWCWPAAPLPCLVLFDGAPEDETCGHGPDDRVL